MFKSGGAEQPKAVKQLAGQENIDPQQLLLQGLGLFSRLAQGFEADLEAAVTQALKDIEQPSQGISPSA